MQEKELRTLHRENYVVPKGEENVVHYKIENILNDSKTGQRISQQILCKTGVVLFETVKRNLELQGNTLEILYHPKGKYTDVVIPLPTEMQRQVEIEAKDAEIERLKAELEKANKKAVEKKEVKETKKK